MGQAEGILHRSGAAGHRSFLRSLLQSVAGRSCFLQSWPEEEVVVEEQRSLEPGHIPEREVEERRRILRRPDEDIQHQQRRNCNKQANL